MNTNNEEVLYLFENEYLFSDVDEVIEDTESAIDDVMADIIDDEGVIIDMLSDSDDINADGDSLDLLYSDEDYADTNEFEYADTIGIDDVIDDCDGCCESVAMITVNAVLEAAMEGDQDND